MIDAADVACRVMPGAAAVVDVTADRALLVVAEGGERAEAVVAAMVGALRVAADDLERAWKAGASVAGGARFSVLIARIARGSLYVVHAGDLALHAVSEGGVQLVVVPHLAADPARAGARVRTRALGLPGAGGAPMTTQVALGPTARLVVSSVRVWAPLGPALVALLVASSSPAELADRVIAAATGVAMPAAMASSASVCVVMPIVRNAAGALVVPTAGQRAAIRAVRAVLSHSVGSRCALIVGERGVGKTLILEQLAGHVPSAKLVSPAQLGRGLRAGTPLAPPGAIVLIDRLADALSEAGPAAVGLAALLARGDTQLIATATAAEHVALVAAHAALGDEFVAVPVAAPTHAELEAIAATWVTRFAARHRVTIDPSAIAAAVELSQRFGRGRGQPEALLFALEQACVRAGHAGVVSGTLSGRGGGVVDRAAVAAALADQLGLPFELVASDDHSRLSLLGDRLAARILGQPRATASVAAAVARGVARRTTPDARPRPLASLLLLGPTGTGKTETARLLAASWFLDRRALTTIDLSEYQDPASVHALLGAPPGYVGHGQRPALAAALAAQPGQVVLFDEIEKAHPDVLDVLLQVCDEGRLTTRQGEVMRFDSAVVVLTSNLAGDAGPRVGFAVARDADDEAADRAALARVLRPELVARIDAVVRYQPFERSAATAVALGHLARAADALIAAGRLLPPALPGLRRRLLGRLAPRTSFPGGGRELQRLAEEVLREQHRVDAPVAPVTVVYPYLDGGRERVASGFTTVLGAEVAGAAADLVLVHPAGAALLYVAHGGAAGDRTRLVALVGDAAAADELAASLRAELGGDMRCATGRVRADVAGRPVGELIDRLLAT